MNKKTIAMLLVVSSSFVSSAFANSIINKLIIKNNPDASSIIKTQKMTKQNNPSYIDFSGTWMVNCGDGVSVSTVIENSADYITLDGIEYRIGMGLQGNYQSNEQNSQYEHMSFEWSADRSALISKGVEVSKYNKDNSSIQTDLYTFTLTMKKGQIFLDGKVTQFSDLTQNNQPMNGHCVFTRKQ